MPNDGTIHSSGYCSAFSWLSSGAKPNARHELRPEAGARELGKRKARSFSRFLTLPVENRTCHLDGIRLSTCDWSPWRPMQRRFPLRPFHRGPPVYRLRVPWVPLLPSSHRLGAFALRSHPGVHGLLGRRLLGPLRLFLRAWAFRWGLPDLLPTRLHLPHAASRVRPARRQQNETGGVCLSWPHPLSAAPQSVGSGEHRLPAATAATGAGGHGALLAALMAACWRDWLTA
jgi:hypothetical protein